MKKIISIVGPTAIGKTQYAIELAKYHRTEILSCDSRQFFKELKIGAATPSEKEMQGIPHHFIGNKSIEEEYNVGTFEKEAMELISILFKTYDTLILVGGSGLYEKALTEGMDEIPTVPKEIREKIITDYQKYGITFLQNELKQKDPLAFEKIDCSNPHRVMRALEVIEGTGKSLLEFQNTHKPPRFFEVQKIGLITQREKLYAQINYRVEQMMEEGLLEEVRHLAVHQDKNALKTVGYTELFAYLSGKYSLDFAIEEIKKNTRRYAKRQLTWFKKDTKIEWIYK